MTTDEIAALRATAHPVRLRMISLLTGSELTAAEIARELGITHANASYHLRVLQDAGMIVEVDEDKAGGSGRRYRHLHERREWRADDTELGQLRAMFHEMIRRHLRGSTRPRTYADAELWLPPETWEEVVRMLQQASALMHERAQPPRTEGTVRASLTIAAFRMGER